MAKWGSILPYRRAAQMLGELLPISDGVVFYATLRRHALGVGARLDQQVTEPDEYDWPESRRDPVPSCTRLTLTIDGTYVRSNLEAGQHEGDRISNIEQARPLCAGPTRIFHGTYLPRLVCTNP